MVWCEDDSKLGVKFLFLETSRLLFFGSSIAHRRPTLEQFEVQSKFLPRLFLSSTFNQIFLGFLTKVRKYFLANTSAYLLFLLNIILLEYFAFLTKVNSWHKIEEGDNYVFVNTSANLPFLLIIILSEYFAFITKVNSWHNIEEGDNYVFTNTSAYLLFLLNIIL